MIIETKKRFKSVVHEMGYRALKELGHGANKHRHVFCS